ncbi:hypothetical protein [Neobacillus drentensis]|uniref:hypothetical protein n=1 Tax=Neobacillus drentensis TaxID=220684 RepID=UPI000826C8A1|nr:hypothetical protein [Neobacillus drentensis]
MSKKIIIALLCLGLIVVLYFSAFRSGSRPDSNTIPTTSLEESICAKVEAQNEDCKKVILIDTVSNVAFVETEFGILPVLISKDHTKMVKMIPGLDFQEFREEKEENGPITWRVENNVQKDFSIIYGFARDKAKTIIINSEGNIQPNKFYVRDDLAGMSGGSGTAALWVWYITSKDEMIKPADITVYGSDGHLIYGGSKEE